MPLQRDRDRNLECLQWLSSLSCKDRQAPGRSLIVQVAGDQFAVRRKDWVPRGFVSQEQRLTAVDRYFPDVIVGRIVGVIDYPPAVG